MLDSRLNPFHNYNTTRNTKFRINIQRSKQWPPTFHSFNSRKTSNWSLILVLKARKACIGNPDAPYYHAVTTIINYLALRRNNEPTEVQPKRSRWSVMLILCLIILMGVLGIYLQSDPEPARPERHQGQMGMQLLCCFLEWAAVYIRRRMLGATVRKKTGGCT